MKNLLEQLSAENLAILTEARTKYPSSVSALLKSLESNQSWIYLTYNDVIMLASYLGLHSYDPSTIGNIFKNEQ
jgi:hypothetical protein